MFAQWLLRESGQQTVSQIRIHYGAIILTKTFLIQYEFTWSFEQEGWGKRDLMCFFIHL